MSLLNSSSSFELMQRLNITFSEGKFSYNTEAFDSLDKAVLIAAFEQSVPPSPDTPIYRDALSQHNQGKIKNTNEYRLIENAIRAGKAPSIDELKSRFDCASAQHLADYFDIKNSELNPDKFIFREIEFNTLDFALRYAYMDKYGNHNTAAETTTSTSARIENCEQKHTLNSFKSTFGVVTAKNLMDKLNINYDPDTSTFVVMDTGSSFSRFDEAIENAAQGYNVNNSNFKLNVNEGNNSGSGKETFEHSKQRLQIKQEREKMESQDEADLATDNQDKEETPTMRGKDIAYISAITIGGGLLLGILFALFGMPFGVAFIIALALSCPGAYFYYRSQVTCPSCKKPFKISFTHQQDLEHWTKWKTERVTSGNHSYDKQVAYNCRRYLQHCRCDECGFTYHVEKTQESKA